MACTPQPTHFTTQARCCCQLLGLIKETRLEENLLAATMLLQPGSVWSVEDCKEHWVLSDVCVYFKR